MPEDIIEPEHNDGVVSSSNTTENTKFTDITSGQLPFTFGNINASITSENGIINTRKIDGEFNIPQGFNIKTGITFGNTSTPNYSISLGTLQTFGPLSLNANGQLQDGKITYSTGANYQQTFGPLSLNANGQLQDGKITYSTGASIHHEMDNDALDAQINLQDGSLTGGIGITRTINQSQLNISSNISENGQSTQLSFSPKPNVNKTTDNLPEQPIEGVEPSQDEIHLINADNINDTQDPTKVRQQALIDTQTHFDVRLEHGYTRENGTYTEGSIMYRHNDNTFLSSNYRQLEHGYNLGIVTDFQPAQLTFTRTQQTTETERTTTNTFGTFIKGKKTQLDMQYSQTGITSLAAGEQSGQTSFSVKGLFNRNQDGEFNEGLNGALGVTLSQTDQNNDYNVSTDIAYNKYRFGTNNDIDVLTRGQMSFGRQGNTTIFSTELGGAYRFNTERTVLEPTIKYENMHDSNGTTESLYSRLGIFQQVGKNYGDAQVYLQGEIGKQWTPTGQTTNYGLYAGGNIRANSRVSFEGQTSWQNHSGWAGKLSMNVRF